MTDPQELDRFLLWLTANKITFRRKNYGHEPAARLLLLFRAGLSARDNAPIVKDS